MAIKKYKPTTPGRRGMTVTDYKARDDEAVGSRRMGSIRRRRSGR